VSDFLFHPEAEGDLDEIWEYIAAHNIEAADRVADEIEDRVRALAAFPREGFRRPDLTSRPLRFVLVRDYLIAYAPDAKPLWGFVQSTTSPGQSDFSVSDNPEIGS